MYGLLQHDPYIVPHSHIPDRETGAERGNFNSEHSVIAVIESSDRICFQIPPLPALFFLI